MDWATPTPYPTPSGLPDFNFDNTTMFVDFAEQSVATWNMANQASFLDGLLAIVLLLAVFAAFRKLRREIQEI
jgi:hypothetical protein